MSQVTPRPIYQKPQKLTAEEARKGKEHMRRVKLLPCVICGAPGPSDAHHVIHDRYGGRKSSDFDTIPLCKIHHQHGPDAIHNGKETWRKKYGPDHGYLDIVKDMLDDPDDQSHDMTPLTERRR